jgi:peptidoglycan/LPS O-acetylase OafA/YrhL
MTIDVVVTRILPKTKSIRSVRCIPIERLCLLRYYPADPMRRVRPPLMSIDRQEIGPDPIAIPRDERIGLLAILDRLLWTLPHNAGGWRPYIDGLRAAAVLAVLFNHSGLVDVPGGFVGVDVFFVISGLLISKVIYDDIAAHGKFRIIDYCERRIRRIVPVFVVVTAASLVAGYVLFLPDEFAALGRSAIAASGFAANVYFHHTTGYFAGQAITKPLLHYWSLGIEEQFYIVFPLIVLAISRFAPRFLGAAILAIAGISFALAEFYVRTAPAAAFYLTPQRAWELMVGCLLALPNVPWLKHRLQREVVAAGGFALIAFAAFEFSDATRFPGLTAVVPVAGAAGILWACGGGPTFVGSLLSFGPLRAIGLWSYSIYMIHWPLVVFARAVWPRGFAGLEGGIVVASLALGCASYLLVEMPFRRPRQLLSRPELFEASAASLMILAALGGAIAWRDGFPNRFPAPVLRILAYEHYKPAELYRQRTCHLVRSQSWLDLQPDCLAAARPSALLWGDSHAAHFYEALQRRFPGIAILQATMVACPPIVGRERFDVPHCKNFNDMVLQWALANRPDTVILSASWVNDPNSIPQLDTTLKALSAGIQPVMIIGETPSYLEPVPKILARRMMRGDNDIRAEDEGIGAPFWGDHYMKDRYGGIDGVRYISSRDSFCIDRECPLVTETGIPVYWDRSHFTREGADLVVKHMFPEGLMMKSSP